MEWEALVEGFVAMDEFEDVGRCLAQEDEGGRRGHEDSLARQGPRMLLENDHDP
jgi:hypothetical protein